MPKQSDNRLKCSFCGKSQDSVKKLIAGPGVYICDECVDLCNEILDEELFEGSSGPQAAPPEAGLPKLLDVPKPKEIKICQNLQNGDVILPGKISCILGGISSVCICPP